MREYIVKSYEEEIGEEIFIVRVPDEEPHKKAIKNIAMAAKYANVNFDEYALRKDYDKHFKQMKEYAKKGECGLCRFMYHLTECCGYNLDDIKYDYIFEW